LVPAVRLLPIDAAGLVDLDLERAVPEELHEGAAAVFETTERLLGHKACLHADLSRKNPPPWVLADRRYDAARSGSSKPRCFSSLISSRSLAASSNSSSRACWYIRRSSSATRAATWAGVSWAYALPSSRLPR